MPCSMAAFISGDSLSALKGFPAPTPIFAKSGHQFRSRRERRAERQHKVQNIEKFRRCLLSLWRQGLYEINCRSGRRRGLS